MWVIRWGRGSEKIPGICGKLSGHHMGLREGVKLGCSLGEGGPMGGVGTQRPRHDDRASSHSRGKGGRLVAYTFVAWTSACHWQEATFSVDGFIPDRAMAFGLCGRKPAALWVVVADLFSVVAFGLGCTPIAWVYMVPADPEGRPLVPQHPPFSAHHNYLQANGRPLGPPT